MVKNNGGNKAKKFASKSFTVTNKSTRFSSDPAEVYAIVNKMMGGNICEVLCVDGITRMCIIRRKFSGKGKRDNWLSKGKWILVGLRTWEASNKEKEKCDLLEVYSDNDKEKLIKSCHVNFRIFLSVASDDNDNETVEFINNREEELFDDNIDESNDTMNLLSDRDSHSNSDSDSDNDDGDNNDNSDSDNSHSYMDNNKWLHELDDADKNELDLPINKITSVFKKSSIVDIDDI